MTLEIEIEAELVMTMIDTETAKAVLEEALSLPHHVPFCQVTDGRPGSCNLERLESVGNRSAEACRLKTHWHF